jgi:hypothetical protein
MVASVVIAVAIFPHAVVISFAINIVHPWDKAVVLLLAQFREAVLQSSLQDDIKPHSKFKMKK